MRKWWKDTNDPSGSFHSAVPVIQFRFATSEGFQRTSQPLSLQSPRDTECSLGDQQWHGHSSVLQITPSSRWQTKGQVPHTAVGKQELCGCHQVHLQRPGGEKGISIWKTTCEWFWASLLKSEVGRFLWLRLSEQWQGLRAAPRLSALPRKGQRFPVTTGGL